jgi:single-stranded DNA-binding protein
MEPTLKKIDKVEIKIWPYYNNKLIVSGKVCKSSLKETERAFSFLVAQPQVSKRTGPMPENIKMEQSFFRVVVLRARASFYDEVHALNIAPGDCVLAIGKLMSSLYNRNDGTSGLNISVLADNVEILSRGYSQNEKEKNQFGF